MSKTIKVIDLLNKIANGKVPAKIKFDDEVYFYNSDSISIETLYRTDYRLDGTAWLVQNDIPLNAEVEIIVEDEEIFDPLGWGPDAIDFEDTMHNGI